MEIGKIMKVKNRIKIKAFGFKKKISKKQNINN